MGVFIYIFSSPSLYLVGNQPKNLFWRYTMKKSLAICIFVLLVIMVSLLLASKHCDHVFENWEVEINATCTEDGIKHSKCTNCDKTISEVIPATGHLESKMEVIKPATCGSMRFSTRFACIPSQIHDSSDTPHAFIVQNSTSDCYPIKILQLLLYRI